ncbi:MAG: hypothetical protein CSA20_08995 [Deltaproteobacteria bacterium]|nr:MAG: hypothetical protein CSA20_08995 [Deltaproteobacteria bacterium]
MLSFLARIFHEYCVKFLKIADIPIYYTENITVLQYPKCSPKVSPYGAIFFSLFAERRPKRGKNSILDSLIASFVLS